MSVCHPLFEAAMSRRPILIFRADVAPEDVYAAQDPHGRGAVLIANNPELIAGKLRREGLEVATGADAAAILRGWR